MNKVYIFAPLLLLAGFIGLYMNFAGDYKAKEEAKAARIREDKKRQQEEEARLRQKAVEDAIRLGEQRKKEKAEKDEKDRQEKEARQASIDARDKAYRDQDKLAKQVERLTKEVEAEKVAITKVEDTQRKAKEEEAFLREFVKKAEGNVKSLAEVLEKIEAADRARAAAEAAAAKAAAKS